MRKITVFSTIMCAIILAAGQMTIDFLGVTFHELRIAAEIELANAVKTKIAGVQSVLPE